MSTICKDDCIVGVYSGGFASQIFDVSRGMKYHLFYHYTLAQVLKRVVPLLCIAKHISIIGTSYRKPIQLVISRK